MERLLDAAAASGRHGPRGRTLLLLMYRRGLRVGAGRGIARVLSYQVAEDIAAGNLVRVLQAFDAAVAGAAGCREPRSHAAEGQGISGPRGGRAQKAAGDSEG
jgi:hypothetical protein